MQNNDKQVIENYIEKHSRMCREKGIIDGSLYEKYGVKRGLRDEKGKGVVAGITNISLVKAVEDFDGASTPCPGELYYRGYNINDLIKGFIRGGRFGFEETAYLLLFSELPTAAQLKEFREILSSFGSLPKNFVRDVIMKVPSGDIMNSMTKSVLTMASYDKKASDLSLDNVLGQCLKLIGIFPMLAVYGYHAYNHYECGDSFYIHRPDKNLSYAENILRMLRPDRNYTKLEAEVLDIALVLHMEHGGGNNSTFTTRVVTSAGSDTYSVIAAALSSLKGARHGGANIKVVEMFEDIKANVMDITDEDEVRAYLQKILNKETFDRRGLIYGMGHAVYSISDPRAKILKSFVELLAGEKGRQADFELYSMIERIAPGIITSGRKMSKAVSANVDFYSGFVYSMLGIPQELFTPIFAIARIVGWSAHRLEELINAEKIMRPAYKSIVVPKQYIEIGERHE